MTELEKLKQQLCPNGVNVYSFNEICEFIRGITYNKTQESKIPSCDDIPVFRANNITLSNNTLNYDDVKMVVSSVKIKSTQWLYSGDILMCAGSGSKEHIGKVAYIEKDMRYSFGGFMGVVRCGNSILPRYMFHILTSGFFSKHLKTAINSTTINNINGHILSSFRFPVPPLPVQKEIVRILDNFTELTVKLTAELTARKKQYEYYRDSMLAISNVPFVKLSKVCEKVSSINWDNCSQEKKYVDLSSVSRETHSIIEKDILTVNADEAPSRAKQIIATGDILFGGTRPMLKRYCIVPESYDNQICSTGYCVLRIDNKVALAKYVYHFIGTTKFYSYVEANQQGASYPAISDAILKAFEIPLPSLEEQERIVSILDRFDTLCNDLTSGLPAEIAARQRQYEYYRDRLLTFKQLSH